MPRIGIRVTDDFQDELKAIAEQRGVSVSDFIRRAAHNEVNNRHTMSDDVGPPGKFVK